MNEVIQIKCPFDGAVLTVRNVPGIETKNVKCPICEHTYRFSEYKRVESAGAASDAVRALQGGEEKTSYFAAGDNGGTDFPIGRANYTIGRLKMKGGGKTFQLRPGRNVIGRRGLNSQADFQIDTEGNKMMSREHLVIEVKNIPGKGFVHYLSLYKEKVNDTFVGSEQLLYGDCIVLRDGDVIRLPATEIIFEIPDEEGTDH